MPYSAAVLPSPCLATVRPYRAPHLRLAGPSRGPCDVVVSLPSSCLTVPANHERRPCDAIVSLRRRHPQAPSLPCCCPQPGFALSGGRHAWPLRAPYRVHPPSRLSPRLALSSRLTSRCSALPPCPGSSCPACCHPIGSPCCLPSLLFAVVPYRQPCCRPAAANCHRPARRSPCSITAPPSSCSRDHPAVALPSRRPAAIARLLSSCCITRPPYYCRSPLSCHCGSLLLRVDSYSVAAGSSSQLLISTWPSLPPCCHLLRSLSPLSRWGCPGNQGSTLL